jgi:3-isopropylmalate/(R)-2-methylmalate dehydratase small subunit
VEKDWIIEGNVWKVGDNINTESIEPSHWQQEGRTALMEHIAELLIPEFPKKMKKGDIWVGGSNLGCSSSRNAAGSLKEKGIGAIICKSSSRIFYRNAINSGMPIFAIGDDAYKINMGDRVKVNIKTGEINDLTTGDTFQAQPFPDFLMEIIEAGGIKQKILKHKSEYPLIKQAQGDVVND